MKGPTLFPLEGKILLIIIPVKVELDELSACRQ